MEGFEASDDGVLEGACEVKSELFELCALCEELDTLLRDECTVEGRGAGRKICNGLCANGELAGVPMVGRRDVAEIGVPRLETFEVDGLWGGGLVRQGDWLVGRCAYPPHGRDGEGVGLLVDAGKGADIVDVEELDDAELHFGGEGDPGGGCGWVLHCVGGRRTRYEKAGRMR